MAPTPADPGGSNEGGPGDSGAVGRRWLPGGRHADRARAAAWWLGLSAVYVACVGVATWPRFAHLGDSLPDLLDPLSHLWLLRWYRTCLIELRSPLFCVELNAPTGLPLGNFSPMQLQAILYLPLSTAMRDEACYNVIWLVGLVSTGLASCLLATRVSGDRLCGALGGLLVMLSGPMMLHAQGHLELICLGGVPLFLWAWIRFVDEPRRGRLAAAVAAYLLVGLSAAYFAVLVIPPAACYLAWSAARAGRGAIGAWLKGRVRWLLRFGLLAGVGLALAFVPQFLASKGGYFQERTLGEFSAMGASWWSFGVPSDKHRAARMLMEGDPYRGLNATEQCSYLGVVCLALLGYAAVRRVRFERAWYWWIALGLLAVLALGAEARFGRFRVPMPGLWLKQYVPLLGPIRAPSRFNLIAAVVAGVIAAAALRHLLGRLRRPGVRLAAVLAIAMVAVSDLAVTFGVATVPPPPRCYAFLRDRDPDASVLEVPQGPSGGGSALAMASCYWQASHRLRTSAGCSGSPNVVQDTRLSWASPFLYLAMGSPSYLGDDASPPPDFNVVASVPFDDYTWLYVNAHGFDYVIVHHDPRFPAQADPGAVGRLRDRLAPAAVFSDDRATVYDRRRLPSPRGPAILPTLGWRFSWDDKSARVLGRQARLMVYQPDPPLEFSISLDARAFREPRRLRLRDQDAVLARWTFRPDAFQSESSGPIRLAPGLHELLIECDGESRPDRPEEFASVWDTKPYGLEVRWLTLELPDPGDRRLSASPDALPIR